MNRQKGSSGFIELRIQLGRERNKGRRIKFDRKTREINFPLEEKQKGGARMYPFRSKIRISLSSRGVFQATTCCSPAQRDPTESVVAAVFLLSSPFLLSSSSSLWDTCTRKCSFPLSTASKRPPFPPPPPCLLLVALEIWNFLRQRRTTLATTRVCVRTTHVLRPTRVGHVIRK